MPRGGQNRKPRRAKIIQGTFRKDRNPALEPEPPVVERVPPPPADLNEWGRVKWRELAPELLKLGLLTTLDLTSLELLCREYGMYREAYQGVYFADPHGRAKPKAQTLRQYLAGRNSQTTPELATMRAALMSYRAFMAEFGLSPSARNRLSVQPPKKAPSRMKELLGARS